MLEIENTYFDPLDLENDFFVDTPLEIEEITVSETPFLDKYTENFNQKISQNIDDFKVYNRDEEINNVKFSLMRRTKNSPVLVGEAGVGKTAIVEGLTVLILKNNVPKKLKNVIIRSLELSNLTNENEDGDFINKFKNIIEELKLTKGKNLLFIDEIHTLVGAGSNGLSMDASNIIKPALARGEIQLIGATTIDEFSDYIEEDRALERRFSKIEVPEPTKQEAIQILEQAKYIYENYHDVEIDYEAVKQAVELSIRYIPDKFLPDKAFDLIDEAATEAVNQNRDKVLSDDVARVIKRLTGIPVSTILKDNSTRLHNIVAKLNEYVKGQDYAINAVSDAVTISQTGLHDLNKPLATMMFLGSTGVGKTELAKSLARVMFDDEEALIRFDMSEYMFAGASKKMVGTKEIQGTLTSKVKNKPYSIVLFDELEKGHREVFDLLLQILDDGRLTDGRGRLVSFKNTIIIMTTNVGADVIHNNYDLKGDVDTLKDREYKNFMTNIEIALSDYFRPEFLNRIDEQIVFKMLDQQAIREIAEEKLKELRKKIQKQNFDISYDESLIDFLSDIGTDRKSGARLLTRVIKKRITANISKIILDNKNVEAKKINIEVRGSKQRIDEGRDRRTLEFTLI
ncbi:ATP-dependent Clp protease ATP-binding subunit ClpC [Enterococcus sp. AZ150]|uniref:AAA family ATPase n=1 Tax=Enterococcus sp. AZ150 TaxID=2774866 RepID=UPI003F1F49EA